MIARRVLLVCALSLLGLLLRYLAYYLLRGDTNFVGYVNAMCNWDCGWYSNLALNGYDLVVRPPDGQANWAFFPLTPLALAGIHAVSGLSIEASGFVLGQITIITAFLVARPLFAGNERSYGLFGFFVLSGPFSYAYSTGMSEPLFFLLVVGVFVALQRRNMLLVGILAALLTATRVTGLLIVIPIALQMAQESIATAKRGGPLRLSSTGLLALAVTPLGLCVYMLYLHLHVGDALAFAHIQSAWDRALGNPFGYIFAGLTGRSGIDLTMAIAAVVGLTASVVLCLRGRLGMGAFTAAAIIVSASTNLTSMLRFVIGLPPVTILAADLLGGGWVRLGLAVAVSMALCVLLSMMWMGGSPLVV